VAAEEEEDEDAEEEEEADDDEGEDDEGELVRSGRGAACVLTDARSSRVHYRGALNSEDEPHGDGTLHFPDGSTLQGQFVDGQVEGEATYTQPDGSRVGQTSCARSIAA